MSLSCYEDPTQAICESFEIPLHNATLSVSNLCKAMDWMPGCKVGAVCNADAKLNATADFCHPVSILADICARDMPRMRGCATYGKVCKQGSRVRQCTDHLPLPYIPTTKEASDFVRSICDEMDHTGCELCTSATGKPCDAMTVYSDLCLMMPEMHQCSRFHSMCSASPTFPLCNPAGGGRVAPPTMKMFFHFGYTDYLLFEQLVPRNAAQYALGLILLFLTAISYEAMLRYQRTMEARWAGLITTPPASTGSITVVSGTSDESTPLLSQRLSKSWWADVTPAGWTPQRVRMARAGFRFVGVTVAYALMLLVMTFNVGYFLAV
ncbi:hypothetical protein HDU67_010444, partial [Dinochytrium kinnereticum]